LKTLNRDTAVSAVQAGGGGWKTRRTIVGGEFSTYGIASTGGTPVSRESGKIPVKPRLFSPREPPQLEH
jgi:hypothetical protein